MTHEPIHTVQLTPHITWQGTRAELDAMLAEGWPLGNIRETETHAAKLERNISAAERHLKRLARWLDLSDEELNNLTIGSIVDDHRKMQADVNAAIAALKGEIDGY